MKRYIHLVAILERGAQPRISQKREIWMPVSPWKPDTDSSLVLEGG